jgi:hypothetical protein
MIAFVNDDDDDDDDPVLWFYIKYIKIGEKCKRETSVWKITSLRAQKLKKLFVLAIWKT